VLNDTGLTTRFVHRGWTWNVVGLER
jgi:hypothetical protein